MPAPEKVDLESIARQAEQDLSAYQAKTGGSRPSGVDGSTELDAHRVFPDSEVKFEPDLVTNRGYNRRIPPEEGGGIDGQGRFTRGEAFEGEGGIEEKVAKMYRERPGEVDKSVLKGVGVDPRSIDKPALADMIPQEEVKGHDRGVDIPQSNEPLKHGRDATTSNLGGNPPRIGGNQFSGQGYYPAEDVPDSIAAENNIPPGSILQASRETEG